MSTDDEWYDDTVPPEGQEWDEFGIDEDDNIVISPPIGDVFLDDEDAHEDVAAEIRKSVASMWRNDKDDGEDF
jgi:hypothetical protein